MKQLKVLVFDIETSPMVGWVWGRFDQNLQVNQIKDDWYVLAFSAKWLGAPVSELVYHDQRDAKNISDDKALLKHIWKLLDEADIVITQNGRNFDSKKLNARFILQGMRPPSPYKHIDTYQIVKSVALFTSNGLDYLSHKLCTKYRKLKHRKFPGIELWKACMARKPSAWAEMKRYNIFDVLSTEELYLKIRAWAPQNTPSIFVVTDISVACETCGGRVISGGTRPCKGGGRIRRYQCTECGRWQQAKQKKEKR